MSRDNDDSTTLEEILSAIEIASRRGGEYIAAILEQIHACPTMQAELKLILHNSNAIEAIGKILIRTGMAQKREVQQQLAGPTDSAVAAGVADADDNNSSQHAKTFHRTDSAPCNDVGGDAFVQQILQFTMPMTMS